MPILLYTSQQAAAIDHQTIESFGLASQTLMEQAGAAVARYIHRRWGTAKVMVFVGTGNNGGDGFVAARWLKQLGQHVIVVAHCVAADQYKASARWAALLWQKIEGEIITTDTAAFQKAVQAFSQKQPFVLVDAICGTAVEGPLQPAAAGLVDQLNSLKQNLGAHVVSIDIPSGVVANTGEVLGPAVKADVTMTMGFEKIGLRIWPGRGYAGKIIRVDLGYPQAILTAQDARVVLLANKDSQLPTRQPDDHKGSYGNVGIVGGTQQMPGAAQLSAYGAMRAGAGKVFVVTEAPVSLGLMPEIIRRGDVETWQMQDQFDWLTWLADCQSVVVGPGLGRTDATLRLTASLLEQSSLPMVVDADALWALAQLEVPRLGDNVVLSPHPGEAAMLLKTTTQRVQQHRLQTVQELAQRYRCIVVLKGAGTLIAAGEQVFVSPYANAALAIGGSGDVLAGLLATLLAQKMSASAAACVAVLLHGQTTQYLKPLGNLAHEIADQLPAVIQHNMHGSKAPQ